jgi:hypothetical protein
MPASTMGKPMTFPNIRSASFSLRIECSAFVDDIKTGRGAVRVLISPSTYLDSLSFAKVLCTSRWVRMSYRAKMSNLRIWTDNNEHYVSTSHDNTGTTTHIRLEPPMGERICQMLKSAIGLKMEFIIPKCFLRTVDIEEPEHEIGQD